MPIYRQNNLSFSFFPRLKINPINHQKQEKYVSFKLQPITNKT